MLTDLSLSVLKNWQLSLSSKPGLRKGQLFPLSHSREQSSEELSYGQGQETTNSITIKFSLWKSPQAFLGLSGRKHLESSF